MDALLHQFFNLDIMSRALPLVLQGLRQTILLCLIVIPLGLIGGLLFALASLSRSTTVRYAIERFPEIKRRKILEKTRVPRDAADISNRRGKSQK